MSVSSSSSIVKPEFSVRIVVCDHYLTKPIPGIDVIYSEFRGSDIKQVPVLRIFGSAPDGRKACLHVHGVFPYFYVPCPTPNPEPQFLYQIAASLDKALNIALKQATSANQHVYKISLVKGLSFYGFHDKDHLYLKVFLYSPNLIKQAVELCANGAILGQTFQPHESHLNFTLQFFIDFNLFGMSNVDLQNVRFRRSGLLQSCNETAEESTEFGLKSESICYYEADCIASHILNRQRVGKGDGIENPGLEEVWNQEKERRKQLNVSMASKSLSQGRIDAEQTESHYKFDQMCLVKLSGLIDKPVTLESKEEQVQYPAESLEGSQLFNAGDVSVHLPDRSIGTSLSDTLRRSLDETLTEDADNTLVNENLALNCSLSLHYSQIQLDNEDLELVDMLQDLDESPVREDSMMATPADKEDDADTDDAEYSQAFHDDTILLDPCRRQVTIKDEVEEYSPSWNDSFWEGANIPQLDGTCDDDHVKKVRKRKMRPFKLGLARPKSKKKLNPEESKSDRKNQTTPSKIIESVILNVSKNVGSGDFSSQLDANSDLSEDEINASRETIDSISDLHLRKSIKKELLSFSQSSVIHNEVDDEIENYPILKLVSKIDIKSESTEIGAAEKYDIRQKYEPVAGPSSLNIVKTDVNKSFNKSINVSLESTSEENKGITSFYDTSKMFDLSLEDSDDMDSSFVNRPVVNEKDMLLKIKGENKLESRTQLAQYNKLESDMEQSDSMLIDDEYQEKNETNNSGSDSPLHATEPIENARLAEDLQQILNSESQNDDSPLPLNGVESDVTMSQVKESESMLETNSQLDFNSQIKKYNTTNWKILTPKFRPPTTKYVQAKLEKYNIPKVKNPDPFYSDYKDVGDKVEISQLVLKLQSKLAKEQKPFEKVLGTTSIEEWRQLMFLQTNDMNEESSKPDVLKTVLAGNRQCVLAPIKKPPTYKEVKNWQDGNRHIESVTQKHDETEISKNTDDLDNSQAIGLNYEDEINSSVSLEANEDNQNKSSFNTSLQVTMQTDGSFLCFGNNESQKESNSLKVATVEVDFLTVMIIEVLAAVRGDLHPDPTIDSIQAVFLTVTNDCPPTHFLQRSNTEIIVVDDMTPPKLLDRCFFKSNVTYVDTENKVIEKVVDLIKIHDPDIMCGYEIEMNSWGYLLERSQLLGMEIVKEISRITEKNRQKRWRSEENDFEGRIIGRIMFNVWRLFRHELALSSYSFENCMYEILKERVPKYTHTQLYEWWSHESRTMRWIAVEYYLTKISGTVRMLEKLDIINRTSELARLFGLQWWEVLSRGSQFRVESLMLRAARPLNLVALSPTVRQRAAMKAPECLPLIFEPESRFYTDPVIVLDFQSLYPSMMIAYNYCFSTCIGRVQNINGDASYEFGAWRLRIPKAKLETLVKNGLVNWSPVGVGFVKPSVRRGVLPALLRRILAARQAVKKGMKLQKDEGVKKAMHSRQLGLKLIANVTYGYTAANFSGRMPCVEVGDSVVAKGRETLERAIKLVRDSKRWNAKVRKRQVEKPCVGVRDSVLAKGRETLERAIKLVRDSKRWNAKVVYGDTDSMFVLVPGGTRDDAFEIGQQIADAVTADNPSPVALKLEKVYQPCILQTKKRYVGYMYESADQEKPVYEAKGIETVRRDGCPAGVKLLQRSLCELFDHGDMSRVKRIVTATLSRLSDGSLPPRELLFTREYHGLAGYRPGASAPPNEIAKRIASRDRRAVPRAGERVAWQVTAGPPGAPLIKLARTPEELIRDPGLTPHVAYYATRVLLPPLHRCLSLLGANVFKWWTELGYNREVQQRTTHGGIARYMCSRLCIVCGAKVAGAVCGACVTGEKRQRAAVSLAHSGSNCCQLIVNCDQICGSCAGHSEYRCCENTECPVIWRRISARKKIMDVKDVISQLPAQFTREMFDF
ncbi:hypothetical protein O0L34_g4319 [Tuta absoluta]|nr:hypothetical protein O0L34_g4319 [Tuta absoluta]